MAATAMTTLHQFSGLRLTIFTAPIRSLFMLKMLGAIQSMRCKGNGALGAHCDFIGSPTNLIMVTPTNLMLFVGRFGLVPSTYRKAIVRLKLEARDFGLQTGDPANCTLIDTLACGTIHYSIGVGIVLSLQNTGAL